MYVVPESSEMIIYTCQEKWEMVPSNEETIKVKRLVSQTCGADNSRGVSNSRALLAKGARVFLNAVNYTKMLQRV